MAKYSDKDSRDTDRDVDKVAGKGSVAGKLKEQRKDIQSGKSTNPVVGGDPSLDAEGNAFQEVENAHNSPNTHEFFRPKEWSGRYVGVDKPKKP